MTQFENLLWNIIYTYPFITSNSFEKALHRLSREVSASHTAIPTRRGSSNMVFNRDSHGPLLNVALNFQRGEWEGQAKTEIQWYWFQEWLDGEMEGKGRRGGGRRGRGKERQKEKEKKEKREGGRDKEGENTMAWKRFPERVSLGRGLLAGSLPLPSPWPVWKDACQTESLSLGFPFLSLRPHWLFSLLPKWLQPKDLLKAPKGHFEQCWGAPFHLHLP